MRLCAFADEASVNLQGQIDALKRNNIEMLEIRGVDGENIKDISKEKISFIAGELAKNDLSVWSIGSPCGKNDPSSDFDTQLYSFEKICESAQVLGATKIRLFSFFTQNEKDALSSLEKFLKVTPKGITLCHENEKGIFGDTYENCLKIHKALPEIKAVFDPANFVQCGVDTKEAWEVLSGYVEYMHIKDARLDKTVVPAGQGVGNLEYLIKKYHTQGGTVLTLEPHLMEFTGLKELENGESVKGVSAYKTTDEAFDKGCVALKEILVRSKLWR